MDGRISSARPLGRLLLLPALALALVAAACGGGTDGGSDGAGAVAIGEQQEGLTVVMDEYSFAPETLTVSAGQVIELTIVNEGEKEHELMIGLPVGGGPAWETDLFARMDPEAMSGDEYHLEGFEGMEEEAGGHEDEGDEMGEMGEMGHGAELEVEAGGEVTIRLHIPEDAVGEWEIGCFLPNHYESGMKGTLIVQ